MGPRSRRAHRRDLPPPGISRPIRGWVQRPVGDGWPMRGREIRWFPVLPTDVASVACGQSGTDGSCDSPLHGTAAVFLWNWTRTQPGNSDSRTGENYQNSFTKRTFVCKYSVISKHSWCQRAKTTPSMVIRLAEPSLDLDNSQNLLSSFSGNYLEPTDLSTKNFNSEKIK